MTAQPVNQFRALRILHTTLLLGIFILLMLSIFLDIWKGFEANASLDRALQVAAVLMAAGGVIGGTRLFKARITAAREQQISAEEKLDVYRAAALLQWALAEGPALFAVISFILTGNYAFVALAAALIIYLTITAPGKLKIMLLLQLSQQDADRLEGSSI